MNDLPGVYIKWFLDKLGHDGLNKLLYGFEDKTAHSQCSLAYKKSQDDEIKIFIGQCQGEIVPARGSTAFGWDAIFQCNEIEVDGKHLTFGELDKDLKNKVSHRYRAFAKFADYLNEKSHS